MTEVIVGGSTSAVTIEVDTATAGSLAAAARAESAADRAEAVGDMVDSQMTAIQADPASDFAQAQTAKIVSVVAGDATVVAATAAAVSGELASRRIPQTTGSGAGGLQTRFPDNGTLGWMSDTAAVDSQTGTTLPDAPTVAALRRVGFPVVDAPSDVPGTGFGIRTGDGRATALSLSDKYDPVTGVVPTDLATDISRGHVTYDKNISGADLAKLVPYGRLITHEQPDGWHWILGEKTHA